MIIVKEKYQYFISKNGRLKNTSTNKGIVREMIKNVSVNHDQSDLILADCQILNVGPVGLHDVCKSGIFTSDSHISGTI